MTNTIENTRAVVDAILHYSNLYTGYLLKYGYFDSAELDRTNTLLIFDHNGVCITSWDLNDAADRGDLMTTNFLWYDLVPSQTKRMKDFIRKYL